MIIRLLNDGGYRGAADNVKFPVEVSGSIDEWWDYFIVHRDELVRVGFIIHPQCSSEFWFDKGSEAVEIELCK
jgi:hypothetical protein